MKNWGGRATERKVQRKLNSALRKIAGSRIDVRSINYFVGMLYHHFK